MALSLNRTQVGCATYTAQSFRLKRFCWGRSQRLRKPGISLQLSRKGRRRVQKPAPRNANRWREPQARHHKSAMRRESNPDYGDQFLNGGGASLEGCFFLRKKLDLHNLFDTAGTQLARNSDE